MAKPCPYRKEHEWEWDSERQTWMCRLCYTVADVGPRPLIKQDDVPTPSHPLQALSKS